MKYINKKRLFCVLLTIVLGLLSRKLDSLPLFIGDILYGIMMYFMVSVFIDTSKKTLIQIMSLFICYAIEISQLFQTPFLNTIRSHAFFKLILGQGFLWHDIISYTIGILFISIMDMIISKRYGGLYGKDNSRNA